MEIVVLLVLALLIFGPKQLPQAGRSLGHAVREFRKATETARSELGLDEMTAGMNDLKSSMSVDLGLQDIKSSMSVDLKAAPLAAAVGAPPADKPVTVAATGSDTTPTAVLIAEAPAGPVAAKPAPAVPAEDDLPATAASAGPDEA
jgi:TatA/E family protein of Tat protein translocase